ncbi:MAG: hypothetical protein QM775_24410 [Pirellulales bacterium]
MTELKGVERVATAVRNCRWLAPGVQDEILRLPWSNADDAAVAAYVHDFLLPFGEMLDRNDVSSHFFWELADRFARTGELESAILGEGRTTLSDGLRQAAFAFYTEGRYDVQTAYVGINFGTLCAGGIATDVTATGELRSAFASYLAVSTSLLLDQLDVALRQVEKFLGLPDLVASSPAVFVEALRRKTSSLHWRVMVLVLDQIVETLERNRLDMHVVAAARFCLDDNLLLPEQRSFSDALAAGVARAALVDDVAIEDSRAAIRIKVRRDQLSVLNNLLYSLRRLERSTESVSWIPELRITREEILDAVAGYDVGEDLDLARVESLFECDCVRFAPLMGDWIDSVILRGKFESFLEEFQRSAEVDLSPSDHEEWWNLPDAGARTLLLALIVQRIVDAGEFKALHRDVRLEPAFDQFASDPDTIYFAVSYLWSCFGLPQGEHEIGNQGILGRFLRKAKTPAQLFAAKFAVLGLALLFSRRQLNIYPLLEGLLDLESYTDYARRGFTDRCGSLAELPKHAGMIDVALISLLAVNHLLQDNLWKVRRTLTGLIGDAVDARRLKGVMLARDDQVSFNQLVRVSALASELFPHLALRSLRLLEAALDLPDVTRSDSSELLATVAARAKDLVDDPKRFHELMQLVTIPRCLNLISEDARAIEFAETVLGVRELPDAEIARHWSEPRRAAWTLSLFDVSPALFNLGRYDRFLALLRPLFAERSAASRGSLFQASFLCSDATDRFWNQVINSTCDRVLTRRYLEALRKSGRDEELAEAVAGLDCPVRGAARDRAPPTALDVVLVAECATTLCDRDPAYVRDAYRFAVEFLEAWRLEPHSSFEMDDRALASEEARGATIRLGHSVSAQAGDREANHRHRVEHLICETALSQRRITARYPLRESQYCHVSSQAMRPASIPAPHRPTWPADASDRSAAASTT